MSTRYNRLVKAVLTSTRNLCFEQKYKKYQNFLYENFHFLEVKFSIYLNRHVFVMTRLFRETDTFFVCLHVQSTLVISNSKGLTETLRDIRTSTYQS